MIRSETDSGVTARLFISYKSSQGRMYDIEKIIKWYVHLQQC